MTIPSIVSQCMALKITGERTKFRAPIKLDKLHTAVSVALSIPSSVQRQMENSALIYSFSADPKVRRRNQGIDL